VSAVLLSTGCASTLSTLQTARPVEPKHFQITAGYGAYLNTGTVAQVVEAGVNQVKVIKRAYDTQEPYALNSGEQRQLLSAGVALIVFPPSYSFEISARTGLMDNWDVGFRYSTNAVRLDTKYRLFHEDNGQSLGNGCPEVTTDPSECRSFDVAIGLGVSKHLFSGFLFEVLEFVKLDDFSRWDIEVPLYISKEFGEVFKLYGAPKYVYSHTKLDEKLVEASNAMGTVQGLDVRLPESIHSHFVGATGGLAIGYKHVHLMLEITAGYTFAKVPVLGEERDMSGVTLYPAGAINFRW
jgi:hypothetical protein